MKLLIIFLYHTYYIHCQQHIPTNRGDNETTTENLSEFVFSKEIDYVNKDEIEKLKQFDTRGPHIAPFESNERAMHTTLTPFKQKMHKIKHFLRLHKIKPFMYKLFKIPMSSEIEWNATEGPGVVRRLHDYVKYTLLKKPTPNATEATTDPLAFWKQHYTDWNYFNNLHHEILNSTNPDNHWFYKTIMLEGYGVNVDDVETTTRLEFDPHRCDGFSTNVTMPPSTEESKESEEEYDSRNPPLDSDIKAITIRPEFLNAMEEAAEKIEIPTIPSPDFSNVTLLIESNLAKRIREKLLTFYWITTADPTGFFLSHEAHQEKKRKKWIAENEKILSKEINEMLNKEYVPDFGPKLNSFFNYISQYTSETVKIVNYTEQTTLHQDIYEGMPEKARKCLEDPNFMIDMNKVGQYMADICRNETISWETDTPFSTAPSITTNEFKEFKVETSPSERLAEVSTTAETVVPLIYYDKILNNQNFSFSKEVVDRAYENAAKNIRELDILKDENNWKIVSNAMWEDELTTSTTEINYDSAVKIFTDKMGTY